MVEIEMVYREDRQILFLLILLFSCTITLLLKISQIWKGTISTSFKYRLNETQTQRECYSKLVTIEPKALK